MFYSKQRAAVSVNFNAAPTTYALRRAEWPMAFATAPMAPTNASKTSSGVDVAHLFVLIVLGFLTDILIVKMDRMKRHVKSQASAQLETS